MLSRLLPNQRSMSSANSRRSRKAEEIRGAIIHEAEVVTHVYLNWTSGWEIGAARKQTQVIRGQAPID
jgi:hypothetical protein